MAAWHAVSGKWASYVLYSLGSLAFLAGTLLNAWRAR